MLTTHRKRGQRSQHTPYQTLGFNVLISDGKITPLHEKVLTKLKESADTNGFIDFIFAYHVLRTSLRLSKQDAKTQLRELEALELVKVVPFKGIQIKGVEP